jgi:outer membrane autotransporter protein
VTIDVLGTLTTTAGTATATAANFRGTLNVGNGGSSGTLLGGVTMQDAGTLLNFNRSDNVTYAGRITGAGSVEQTGGGTLTLSGASAYTGATTVSGGGLIVNTSIASSSGLTVANNAFVGGTGTLPTTVINSGGTLAPGNSIGAIAVQGNLTFNAGSTYAVEFSPTASDRTNATGTATINGGTVQATALPGSFSARTYTIINATGGVTGTFGSLVVDGAPLGSGARNPHLTYDANNVFLVLDPGTITLPAGTSGNQRSVATGINNAVLAGTTVPAGFDAILSLTGPALTNALSQLSGPAPTGASLSAVQMMNAFLSLTLNPYGGAPGGNPGALGYARAMGASETLPQEVADAYAAAMPVKAPPSAIALPAQRWSLWGQVFGGRNKTDGDAIAGTSDTTAKAWGFAAGADYRVSRDTVIGFALAGGETNWSVSGNLGGGRSDVFQAGVYGSHRFGAAYVSGALAYAWYDMKTERTVIVGGFDILRGDFNANSFGGRIESGYRFATRHVGITPYAAAQVQHFKTPSYTETSLTLSPFALSFASQSTTATRVELGSWFDQAFALNSGNAVALRGRLAWAHDEGNNGGISTVFQSLPGSNFIVNGAKPASDLALVSAGAELRLRSNVSLAARFDGELASRAQTYAGTGTARYVW